MNGLFDLLLVREEGTTPKNLPPFQERHLNAPLTDHDLNWVDDPKETDPIYLKQARTALIRFETAKKISTFFDPDSFHQWRSLLTINWYFSPSSESGDPFFSRSLSHALSLLDDSLLELLHLTTNTEKLVKAINSNKELQHLLFMRKRLETCVDVSTLVNSGRKVPTVIYHGEVESFLKVDVTQFDSFYIRNNILIWRNRKHYLRLTHNMLLMVNDVVSSRALSLLAATIYEITDPFICPPPHLLSIFYRWIDECLLHMGNKGFDALKMIEPLCVGAIHQTGERDEFVDQELFFNQMIEDTCKVLNQDKRLVSLMYSWLKPISQKDSSPHWASQLHGCFRHGGHPILNSLEALEKMRAIGRSFKLIDHVKLGKVNAQMVKTFVLTYIRKNGSWPLCSSSDLREGSEIKMSHQRNRMPDQTSPRYLHDDWTMLRFEKNFEPLEAWSLLTLVADKSHSPLMREIKKKIKQNPRAQLGDKLILSTLKKPDQSVREFLSDIDQEGLSEEDLVVGERVKERELKVPGRMFALLGEKMRYYFAATESCVSEQLLKYYPSITMKDSSFKLKKRLHHASKEQSGKGTTVCINMSLDFSSWNLHQRGKVHEFGFKFQDRLFGWENVISRTHHFISDSLIYISDGSGDLHVNKSGEIDGKGCYRGHVGGLEGQRQKSWTIFTSSGIEWVAESKNVRATVMGQGDNQIISFSFDVYERDQEGKPVESEIKRISKTMKEIEKEIHSLFMALGMPTKMEESFMSSHYTSYGKVMYMNGAPLSQTLKRCSRATYMVNDGYPSLNGALSSIGTTMISMSECDFTPLVSLILGLTEQCRAYLEYKFFDITLLKGLQNFDSRDLMFKVKRSTGTAKKQLPDSVWRWSMSNERVICWIILVVPSCIGGYAVINPLSLLVKLFPDPVTEAYSLIMGLSKITKDRQFRQLLSNTLVPRIRPDVDPVMILQDPTSINLDTTVKEDNIMKAYSSQYLRLNSKGNPTVHGLATHFKELRDPLAQYLFSATPLDPKVLSDLFSTTPPALYEKLMGRLKKTNTIRTQVYAVDGDNLTIAMQKASRESHLSFLYHTISKKPEIPSLSPVTSPSSHSQSVRELSWKREDIVNITVPHPISSFDLMRVENSNCQKRDCTSLSTDLEKDYITLVCNHLIIDDPVTTLTRSLGPSPPYLGSKTQEKATDARKIQVSNLYRGLKKPIDMVRMVGWVVDKGSNMESFIRSLVSSYTDYDYELLVESTVIGSGSFGHRYQDSITKHGGAPASLLTPFSHFHLSTTTLEKYSKGGLNYNLHFQATMIVMLQLVTNELLTGFSSVIPNCYHFHESDSHEIQLITEEKLETPEPVDIDFVQNPVKGSMFYVSAEQLKFRMRNSFHYRTNDILDEMSWSTSPSGNLAVGARFGYKMMEMGLMDLSLRRESSAAERSTQGDLVGFYKLHPVGILCGALLKILEHVILHTMYLENVSSELKFVDLLGSEITSLNRDCFSYLSPLMMLNSTQEILCDADLLHVTIADVVPQMWKSCENIKSVLLRLLRKQLSTFLDILSSGLIVESALEMTIHIHVLSYIGNWISDQQREEITIDEGSLFRSVKALFSEVSVIIRDSTFQGLTQDLPSLTREQWLRSYEIESILSYPERVRCDINRIPILLCNTTLPGLYKSMRPIQAVYEDTHFDKFLQLDMIPSAARMYSLHLPNWGSSGRQSDDERNKVFLDLLITDLRKNHLTFSEESILMTQQEDEEDIWEDDEKKLEKGSIFFPYTFFTRTFQRGTKAQMKLLSVTREMFGGTSTDLSGHNIGVFGDGSGGWTTLMLMISNPNAVFYNSLVTLDDSMLHSVGELSCPAGNMLSPELRRKIIGKELLRSGTSDLTSPKYAKAVKEYLKRNYMREFSIVLCDAEHGGVWNNQADLLFSLSMALVCLETLLPNGTMCMKTYLVDSSYFSASLGVFLALFEKVSVIRSQFSLEGNTEVYLLCSGFKKDEKRLSSISWRSYKLGSKEYKKISDLIDIPPLNIRDASIYQKALEHSFGFNDLENLLESVYHHYDIRREEVRHLNDLIQMVCTRGLRFSDVQSLSVFSSTKSPIHSAHRSTYKEIVKISGLMCALIRGDEFLTDSKKPKTIPSLSLLVYVSISNRPVIILIEDGKVDEIKSMLSVISDKVNRGKIPDYSIWHIEPTQSLTKTIKDYSAMIGYLSNKKDLVCKSREVSEERSPRRYGFFKPSAKKHNCRTGTIYLGSRSRPKSTLVSAFLRSHNMLASKQHQSEKA